MTVPGARTGAGDSGDSPSAIFTYLGVDKQKT